MCKTTHHSGCQCHEEQWQTRLNAATTLAGELIAAIRINVMRDTFRDATIEQVDAYLKPWIERLNEIRNS
jgi:hypothetical protein